MYNFKDKTYAVLEFTTIDGYFSNIAMKKEKIELRLNFPAIIEMTAVKIKDGNITEHFSTFVGIDGCNPNDIRLDSESPELYGITAEHLICAPSLTVAAERLFEFTGGCTLITKFAKKDSRNPLHIVKKYMEPEGYVFNNPVVSLNNIIAAIKISENVGVSGADAYRLALSLEDKESYNDLVAKHLNCDAEIGRQDSLSRALIMAKLFIELTKKSNELIPIDNEVAFFI